MKAAVVTLTEGSEPTPTELAAACPDALGSPDLVLAFLPVAPETEAILACLAQTWPGSLRLGCESSRQIAEGAKTRGGCLLLFRMENPAHRVRARVIEGRERGSLPAEEAVDEAVRELSSADTLLFLSDGLRFPIQWLLDQLRRRFASAMPAAFGTLASQPLSGCETGARVFHDRRLYTSACVLVGFEGVGLATHLARDWQPASPVYTVSAARGRELLAIDGEPAVEWYRRFFTVDGKLAPMPDTAYSFPLIIEGPDPARRGLYRSLRVFDRPNGGATFWADLRQGDQVRLAIRGPSAPGWSEEQLSALATRAEAALLFACIGRTLVLGEEHRGESQRVKNALGSTCLAGCYTFGEIALPVHGDSSGEGVVHHNQTAVLGLLREKQA